MLSLPLPPVPALRSVKCEGPSDPPFHSVDPGTRRQRAQPLFVQCMFGAFGALSSLVNAYRMAMGITHG